MDPQKFLARHFEWYQASHHWYAKAIELRRSARALYKSLLPGLRRHEQAVRRANRLLDEEARKVVAVRAHCPDARPVYMLYGFALENLLKGLLIARNPHLIGKQSLSKIIKRHGLRALLADAHITTNSTENDVLRWTEEVVIWKARYPVPTDVGKATELLEGSLTLRQYQRRKQILESIFVRVENALKVHTKRPRGFGVLVRLD